ncbi:MAG: hypothetical protein ACRDZ4_08315 [Egibacteraceae bacterium]
MSVMIVQMGGGERRVYRARRLYAVMVSRAGMKAWQRRGGYRKGAWWPVHSVHASRASARVRISDAVANREWPRGHLIVVPAMYADGRDGIFT